jgi:hypothetical protein
MKYTQLFLISLIVVFVAAIKADATTSTSVQGFVCNSSDPHGATAKFVNYKGALQLYLSLSDNSYDQAGALLGDVTAIPSTLSFVVTPVTNINDDAIFLVVYFKYNGNLYSSQYMNPQIVQHGATYTYTFSSGKADPPIPPGSQVQSVIMQFYQASSDAASAYFNNFYVNGKLVTDKIMKDASCPW